MKKRYFFISFFLISFFLINCLSTTSSYVNPCGGSSLLEFEPGDFCVPPTSDESCPYGLISCLNRNTVICIPNCTITTKMLTEKPAPPSLTCPYPCKNGGICNDRTGLCVCPPAFSGTQCHVEDLCARIDCGPHGKCNSGTCVCEQYFIGRFCEVRKNCQLPNKIWTGTECKCQEGFAGDECDRCVENLLCIPLINNPKTHGSFIVSNSIILQNIMGKTQPPPYQVAPYIPTIHENCQCTREPIDALTKFSIAEYYSPNEMKQTSRRATSEDYVTYLHHFYDHHYVDRDQCDLSFLLNTTILIPLILLIIFCLWYCCGGCRFHVPTLPNQILIQPHQQQQQQQTVLSPTSYHHHLQQQPLISSTQPSPPTLHYHYQKEKQESKERPKYISFSSSKNFEEF